MKSVLQLYLWLTIIILLSVNFEVSAQAFEWVNSCSNASGYKTITDNFGDIYAIGGFHETTSFGNTQFTSRGHGDIFLIKYASDGSQLWVKQFGSEGYEMNPGITLDNQGNIYITATYEKTLYFGTNTLESVGTYPRFIIKLDKSGQVLWATRSAGFCRDMFADKYGNLYITGGFEGTVSFEDTELTATGNSDIYIAKHNTADGKLIWVKQAGGIDKWGDEGSSVAADNNGNIYVTGSFESTADFGTHQITSTGGDDIFLAKYNSDGDIIWIRQTGNAGNDDLGVSLCLDKDGNVYFTGRVFSSMLESTQLKEGVFVAKYNPDGILQWVRQSDGKHYTYGMGICTDSEGNVVIAGIFNGWPYFGDFKLISFGVDIFIVKYNSNGDVLWAQKAGGESYHEGTYWNCISADANGDLFVSGYFNGIISFGQFQLTSKGDTDFFLCKLKGKSGNTYVTSPKGGEVWQSGTIHNITWISTLDTDLKIELSTNSGISWSYVGKEKANIGNYNFKVPKLTSDECIIRLTNAADQTDKCMSPGSFTITTEKTRNITITSPDLQLTWAPEEKRKVAWKTTGKINKVKIELTTDNGLSWTEIANSVSAIPKHYTWYVTNTPSTQTRVKITDVDYPNIYDVSNQLFTISYLPSKNKKESESEMLAGIPNEYILEQNYPNPFNPNTLLRYSLPYDSNVKLVVYNLMGEVVQELINSIQTAGIKTLNFDAGSLSSGVYIYSIYAASEDGLKIFRDSKKFTLLK